MKNDSPTRTHAQRDVMERELADARGRLDGAMTAGGIASWVMDLPSLKLYGDANLRKWYDVDPADLDGGALDKYLAAVHPDDLPRVQQHLGAAIESGDTYLSEYRLRSADGERWVLARGRIDRDEQGIATRMSGVVLDVGDRRRAEAALRQSEIDFRQLADSMPQIVWTARPDGHIDYYNERWYDLSGQPRGEDGHQSWEPVLHPDDVQRYRDAWYRSVQSGEPFQTEIRFRRADDEAYRWHLGRALPIRDEAGRITRWIGTGTDIEDQKQTEAALRQSEERYRGLFESMDEGFCILEMIHDDAGRAVDYRFVEVNRVFERQTGLGDALGRTMREMVPGIERRWIEMYDGVARTGEPIRFEDHAESMGRWFDVYAFRLGGEGSRLVAVLFKDTTADKRAEQALRDSERRLRELADAMPQMVWTARPDGHVESFNRRWYEVTGLSDTGLTGAASWEAVTHPDDVPHVHATWVEAIRTGNDFEMEFRLRRGDGTYHWKLGLGKAVRDQHGQVVRWIGTHTDIHDRKLTADALRRSEARLSDVMRTALDCIVGMDADGRVIDWNPAAERTFGWTRDEVLGKEMARLIIPPQYRDMHRDGLASYLKTGDAPVFGKRLELTALRRDGSEFPVELTISPTTASEPPTFTGFLRDITERKHAERTLRDSEERLRVALAIAELGTFEIDLRSDAVSVNAAGREIYGWPPDEVLSFAQVQRHFHPDDRGDVMRRLSAALEVGGSGEFEVEQRIVRTDDRVRWIRVRGRAVFEEVGGAPEAVRCVGTYLDVTEAKETDRRREQMLEAERAARTEAERASQMKDEFLATLSHELRTPLNAILGWSQVLRNSGGDADDVAEATDVIERNARAQTQIIEDLLDMSRIISGKIRLDVQEVDLEGVVRAAIETVTPAAEAKNIRIQPVLDPLAHPVSGDPNRLQQVFWNLLSNAVKFSPKGGRVQVLLKRINSHLEVDVIDTGEGIEPQFLPFVFDRFRQADASTTRNHGGLGLGLAIVKQLIELHGGSVRVRSGGRGQGTTFSVLLPLTVLHPEPDEVVRRHPRGQGGAVDPSACAKLAGLKVLVVDDEADARVLVRRLLSDCDAEVVVAGSAAEALCRLGEVRPDVLVSDIGMPGEDGYALIRRVRELPDHAGGTVPAIALTAYARAEDRVKVLTAGYHMHLSKPVEPAELVTVVASLASRVGRRPTANPL